MLRFRSFVVGMFVVAGITMMPAAAHAEIMTFQGVGAASSISVGGSNAANYHGTVTAGELLWQWVGTPPAGFAQSFYSYCVDLGSYVQSPQTVALVSSTSGFTNGVANGGAKAAWLFTEYAAGIHSLANSTTAAINAAALQVAIWEAMYDTSANLTTGAFSASGNTQITNQASTYLSALYNAQPWTRVATILSTNGGQDQITQVGEPSTLLLVGLAFFGFATLARRPVARQS